MIWWEEYRSSKCYCAELKHCARDAVCGVCGHDAVEEAFVAGRASNCGGEKFMGDRIHHTFSSLTSEYPCEHCGAPTHKCQRDDVRDARRERDEAIASLEAGWVSPDLAREAEEALVGLRDLLACYRLGRQRVPGATLDRAGTAEAVLVKLRAAKPKRG